MGIQSEVESIATLIFNHIYKTNHGHVHDADFKCNGGAYWVTITDGSRAEALLDPSEKIMNVHITPTDRRHILKKGEVNLSFKLSAWHTDSWNGLMNLAYHIRQQISTIG